MTRTTCRLLSAIDRVGFLHGSGSLRAPRAREAGSILLLGLVISIMLLLTTVAAINITVTMGKEVQYSLDRTRALAVAEGVTEIKTAELRGLVEKNADMTLYDARPEARYAQSHLPGAISLSVDRMAKDMAAALPKEKDKLLVFYCGGPT